MKFTQLKLKGVKPKDLKSATLNGNHSILEQANRESEEIKLYSAWYCPFAQRAWLTLLHKNISFEYVETAPYYKTDEWMAISRQTGQVPVLTTARRCVLEEGVSEQTTVVDSTRVMEYVDQLESNQQSLYSDLPTINAEQKFWIDHINGKVVPYFYRFLKYGDGNNNDEKTEIGADAKHKLISGIETLVEAMDKQGPFFSGDSINAVDLAFIPFAHRIDLLLNHYRGFHLPSKGDTWQRYRRWYEANIDGEVFRKTSVEINDYENRLIEFYLPYSLGGGQSDVEIAA